MTTARQRVYSHLKKARAASAREIARALKMSVPTVRHHLSILCSDGRVQVQTVSRLGRKGRPERLYALVVHGDNLPALANALLGETSSKSRLDILAKRILDPAQFDGLPISKRLPLLIEKLNEMNYEARWEAGAVGPRVVFGRCPYARVIDTHPELCRMDEVILQIAFGKPVERSIKTGPGLPGLCPFLFM